MQTRPLGRTGLTVSVLGFGCGAVGGLMVRGAAADQAHAVARAVEAGITYFDTAPSYGDGASERHLGRVLAELKPDVYIGTKVRLDDNEKTSIASAITTSLEASLRRLGLDHVDLLQLHNAITEADAPGAVTARAVLEQVIPAFERLRDQGKISFFGITAIGETEALHRIVAAGVLHTAQVPYNLLNPSVGAITPPNYPAQDYRNLLAALQASGMGAIGIRVLAGGALSAEAGRHPIASPPPQPIGSAATYDADLARARRLLPLVTEGHASTLPEAALRYVIAHPAISTLLIGIATIDQLSQAIAAVEKGPLSPAALHRAAELQRAFVGESRYDMHRPDFRSRAHAIGTAEGDVPPRSGGTMNRR
jgi:aryl-alcohol dehydrogenase-like predicted oxidoreductase